MPNKLICVFLVLIGYTLPSSGQENQIRFTATTQDSCCYHKFEVLYKHIQLKPNLEVAYSWYLNNKLHTTVGGYEGRLLDGWYQSFYLNDHDLLSRGKYVHGLKEGRWIEWFENGNIKTITFWKDGYIHGVYEEYSMEGKLIKRSKFKFGIIDGYYSLFDNTGKECKKTIQNGREVDYTEETKKSSTIRKIGLKPKRKKPSDNL